MQQLDERFHGILWMRNAVVTMMEMKENVYDVEDDLLLQFDKVRAQLYTLQLQPFIELREIAFDQLGKHRGGGALKTLASIHDHYHILRVICMIK